jgi:hypothetical protein
MRLTKHIAGDILTAAVAASVLFGAASALLLDTREARPHQAMTAAGEPLPIVYPPSCCNSAATSPHGDCAPISDEYVHEGPNGYEINLPIGAHPKLKTKGYSAIIPYRESKQPISNDYHICLATDGSHRYCFFGKPGAV